MHIDTILLIVAAICFALVAVQVNPLERLNLLGLGLLAWVLTLLI